MPGLMLEAVIKDSNFAFYELTCFVAYPETTALEASYGKVESKLFVGRSVMGDDVGIRADCAEESVFVVPREDLLDYFGRFWAVCFIFVK